MTEPVKLSRERWNALSDHWAQMLIPGEPILAQSENALSVTRPVEIDGITFLPATYVPSGEPRQSKVMTLAQGGAH